MGTIRHLLWLTGLLSLITTAAAAAERVELRCEVVDAESQQPLACRVYLRSQDGRWLFVAAAVPSGSAIEYRKQRGEASIEMHTTVSQQGFVAELAPGKYQLTIERGKEYLPAHREVQIGNLPQRLTIPLRRWVNMARRNWYSGDTHVHRSLEELPHLLLVEDLNVALPLNYWVTVSDTPPSQSERNQKVEINSLIKVDQTHVIWPLNTEYEIFRVGDRRHTLGAIFALNHKSVFQRGVPPVGPIARQVRDEGGLLELDKHNWPWSMMLVPVMKVDLYELTNNHLWRTHFYYRTFGEPAAPYMSIERDENGMTERGWIDFTLQNYYALLNCGFRLRPTAGTASGVHPVPLGFGRVYVQLPNGFSYRQWIRGLDAGRSFVTTGPMLDVRVNNKPTGTPFRQDQARAQYTVDAWLRSANPLKQIDILSAGEVLHSFTPSNRRLASGAYENHVVQTTELDASTWLAVRCFAETPQGRVRFAHTGPFHIDVAGSRLRPRREEVQYLIQRVQAQIERNQGVLGEPSMQEYRDALQAYETLLSSAR